MPSPVPLDCPMRSCWSSWRSSPDNVTDTSADAVSAMVAEAVDSDMPSVADSFVSTVTWACSVSVVVWVCVALYEKLAVTVPETLAFRRRRPAPRTTPRPWR